VTNVLPVLGSGSVQFAHLNVGGGGGGAPAGGPAPPPPPRAAPPPPPPRLAELLRIAEVVSRAAGSHPATRGWRKVCTRRRFAVNDATKVRMKGQGRTLAAPCSAMCLI